MIFTEHLNCNDSLILFPHLFPLCVIVIMSVIVTVAAPITVTVTITVTITVTVTVTVFDTGAGTISQSATFIVTYNYLLFVTMYFNVIILITTSYNDFNYYHFITAPDAVQCSIRT
jgi:hypothetical protein